MSATMTEGYDDLVRRHGYAEDWEINGLATPDAIRSHIASLETAATEEAAAGRELRRHRWIASSFRNPRAVGLSGWPAATGCRTASTGGSPTDSTRTIWA
jgi:hypothetical protein